MPKLFSLWVIRAFVWGLGGPYLIWAYMIVSSDFLREEMPISACDALLNRICLN